MNYRMPNTDTSGSLIEVGAGNDVARPSLRRRHAWRRFAILKRAFLCAPLAAVMSAAFAQSAGDGCEADVSKPQEAYNCSEKQLGSAKVRLEKQMAATAQVFPSRPASDSGVLVTKQMVRASQFAWNQHVQLQCSLISKLPGVAGDWHFQAASRNLCEITEITSRVEQLEKWRLCVKEGGGVCLP